MQEQPDVTTLDQLQCTKCDQVLPMGTVKCSYCNSQSFRCPPESAASVTGSGATDMKAALAKLIERIRRGEWCWSRGDGPENRAIFVRPGKLAENVTYARDADEAGYLVKSHGLQLDEIDAAIQAILDGAE